MAAQSTLINSSLSLKYKDGIDTNGKDVIKTKKFSNVKISATAQDIYDTSMAFAPLMAYGITDISRIDDNVIRNM